MTGVTAGKNENFENLLKRFNRSVQQSGVLSEMKHTEFYEKPSEKKKRKETAKRRKSARETSEK